MKRLKCFIYLLTIVILTSCSNKLDESLKDHKLNFEETQKVLNYYNQYATELEQIDLTGTISDESSVDDNEKIYHVTSITQLDINYEPFEASEVYICIYYDESDIRVKNGDIIEIIHGTTLQTPTDMVSDYGKYLIDVDEFRIKRSLSTLSDYKSQQYTSVQKQLEELDFTNISTIGTESSDNLPTDEVVNILVNDKPIAEYEKYELDAPIVIEYSYHREKTSDIKPTPESPSDDDTLSEVPNTPKVNTNNTEKYSSYYAQIEAIINDINAKSGNQMVSYTVRTVEPGLTINLHTDSLAFNSLSELKIVLQSLNSKLVETARSVGFSNPPLYYTVDGVEVGNNRFIVNPLEIKYNDILK